MINGLAYDDVLKMAHELSDSASMIVKLNESKNIQELSDFAATVDGYAKYLETTVNLHKDAEEALADLAKMKK